MPPVVNPFAAVTFERDGHAIVAMEVRAPLLRRGTQVSTVRLADDPALFKALMAIVVRKSSPPLDEELEGKLARAGVLASPEELPHGRPAAFSCPAVGKGGIVQAGAEPPVEIAARVGDLSWLSRARPIVWTEDARTGVLLPGWPGDGSPAPPVASPRQAGTDVERARDELAQSRYTVFRALLPGVQLAALVRYYAALAEEGFFKHGDGQSGRWVLENEGVARWLQHQWTGLMSRIAGEPLRPTFAYVGAYHTGDDLSAHRDRPQCALSLSLLVDYQPAPEGDSRWPLYFESGDGEVACHQGIGDAIVYRGCEMTHRRGPMPDQLSLSVLVFYVPIGFTGSLA